MLLHTSRFVMMRLWTEQIVAIAISIFCHFEQHRLMWNEEDTAEIENMCKNALKHSFIFWTTREHLSLNKI